MVDWRQSIYREHEKRGKTRRTEGESDREIAAKSLFTGGKDKANLQYRGLPEYSFYEHLGECNAENKCLVYFKN